MAGWNEEEEFMVMLLLLLLVKGGGEEAEAKRPTCLPSFTKSNALPVVLVVFENTRQSGVCLCFCFCASFVPFFLVLSCNKHTLTVVDSICFVSGVCAHTPDNFACCFFENRK